MAVNVAESQLEEVGTEMGTVVPMNEQPPMINAANNERKILQNFIPAPQLRRGHERLPQR